MLAVVVYVIVGIGAPHVGYGVMLAAVALPLALSARLTGRALGRPTPASGARGRYRQPRDHGLGR